MTKNEIYAKRKEIYEKIIKKEKITKEEEIFYDTSPIYNKNNFELLHKDSISIDPNCLYEVKIRIIKDLYDNYISPIIGIPLKKGDIYTDFELFDINSNKSKENKCKLLVLKFDSVDNDFIKKEELEKEYIVKVKSLTGYFDICYECKIPKYGGYVTYISAYALSFHSMKKVVISDNNYVYHCLTSTDDDLTKFIFSVEWKKI